MSDLISRKAAQKLICEDGTRLERDGVYEMTMCTVKQWAVDLLDELPSVMPERKPGKWEYIQYDGNPKIGNWHCSNCRLIVNLGFEGEPYYHYCPMCGVKMEDKG